MSFNQTKPDKSENYNRKPGRPQSSTHLRGPSGAYGRGSGGTAPSPLISRGKKSYHNAQGAQPRANVPNVNTSDSNFSTLRGVQNGAHVQPPLHGASDAPVNVPAAKQAETSASQRNFRVPKAPTSQHATVTCESTATTTPTKAPDDGSKAVTFQFGSISPGFMNGMQIPARTSSAPPNLDEQKRDQARHNSVVVPSLPTPNVPKQQLPRKDPVSVDQLNTHEAHSLPKVKKDVQVSPAPPASQTHKPSGLPMTGISMSIPFHQPQVPMQFGGPNQPIQSQGVPANSLQMPMPLPLQMGNAPPVQPPPMFVPGLQAHPMQHQGMMHQGQNLSFTSQMAQMPPQLSNIGMIAQQYSPQPGGKYSAPRKTTVKITNPKTHEEVRFDKRSDGFLDSGSSGPRSHPNVPPQSQPVQTFPGSHTINYYPTSYNYFSTQSSHPLTSGQIPPSSQAPRFNYPGSQAPQGVTIMNPPALSVNKSGTHMHGVLEPANLEHTRDAHNFISSVPSGTTHVIVRPSAGSVGEKVEAVSINSTTVEKSEMPKPVRLSAEVSSSQSLRDSEISTDRSLRQSKAGSDSIVSKAAVVADSSTATPAAVIVGPQDNSSVPVEPDAAIEQEKKQLRTGFSQSQVGGQSISVSSLPSQTSELCLSLESGASEIMESSPTLTSLVSNKDVSESTEESLSTPRADTTDASVPKAERIIESSSSISSEISGTETAVDKSGSLISKEEKAEKTLSVEPVKQGRQVFEPEETAKSIDISPSETTGVLMDGPGSPCTEYDMVGNKVVESSSEISSNVDTSSSRGDSISNNEVSLPNSGGVEQSQAQVIEPAKHEGGSMESVGGGSVENLSGAEVSVPGACKDRPASELSRTKSTLAKGKKKRKELLQKADAAGTTSDLYMAYKGPEEKKESVVDSEGTSSRTNSNQVTVDVPVEDVALVEKDTGAKSEPDDWEDAADVSKPKLETVDNGEHARLDNDDNKNTLKKYSRDFLLKFRDQFTDVPKNFEITADISDLLLSNVASHLERNSLPSPGRIVDRPGAPRLERRGSGMMEDDRWSKVPSPYGAGRDLRLDIGFVPNAGFRPGPGQVANYGVLRNPRGGQTPVQFVPIGGILSGPMQSLGPQGPMQRNSPDSERWQRSTNFHQRGLIPSPQTQLLMMHKTEKKYEVGKVTDEEQAKQRQLKGILNKLTPQNFDKLFEQVKAVNIDNAGTLRGVIAQIFDKALMEPTFCEMYANFCFHLSGELPDFSEDNEKITFKRLLLNKCQEEFERGEREQEEANKADEEGEEKQSEEEREEKRIKARRRMLGNIRLIGELYKKKMLTERIMHECIKKLLGQHQTPDEEDVEALCKLMSTIGEIIDHPKAKEHIDAYFDWMKTLSNNMKLSSRVRFMLKDAIDLRKNKWQQRRKVEGPKKIEEVHRDAAQERQAQTSRLSRGASISTPRRGPNIDYGARGSSMLSSPSSQISSFRPMPGQVRSFGNSQDVRADERPSFEGRTLSVPLTQRTISDEAITLGPQGGLARGMSIRGPPSMSSASMADVAPNSGDSRRMAAGINGYGSVSDRGYSPSSDHTSRFIPDRFSGQSAYDQSSAQERNINYGGRDLRNTDAFDRSVPNSPPTRGQATTPTQSNPTEKTLPEEHLREKSRTAIKEFYSASDEKEVAQCIKELNSPSFHATMISLWVTDSFEEKDLQRELLAKLLVSLRKSHGDTLSQSQLFKGFESVLSNFEDTVTDAPKAPEYLGRIFAKVITENVASLGEIGKLIRDGGEEPGSLVDAGLAGDVLGNTLEIIRSDKGDSVFKEIIESSNMRLESFRPPEPLKSRILEKFI
ncbi:eukaryotic translation initiation factor 4G [Humulus lupulus]|uniref:eukaryotic translation initiation factor 4G n=1 Tax=Humulus lupulus TaxID=3486 RepID=UPI002B415872|nr:eukaryotic translation initiation factor 4G [Humulus lupulus]XP_062097462.1 eukaryotic translation initiation factor 4G [Humulus lupulus]